MRSGILLLTFVAILYSLFPLNSKADSIGYIYSSPQPNAAMVRPETAVTVRYPTDIDEESLSNALFLVVGSQSGLHQGNLILADDQQTIIFKPHEPFTLGEHVALTIQDGIRSETGIPLSGDSFQFAIMGRNVDRQTQTENLFQNAPFAPLNVDQLAPSISQTAVITPPIYHTIPSDFPGVQILTPANGTDDGYLFLSNFIIDWSGSVNIPYTPYLLMLDDDGEPVYYRRMTDWNIYTDFKAHPNGLLSYFPWGSGKVHVMDNTYTIVESYSAANGYTIDIHEFLMLPNGNVLFMIYDRQPVDMSQIVPGGDPNAIVTGLVLQELDANKNVVFQWRSWDHMEITDSTVDLTAQTIDYVHGNAIDVDSDGNLLISSRHLNEITKINRTTGEIMWRLGGNKNEFTFIGGGDPFARQHDIRVLPNGNITLFDNQVHATGYARAVEYELDEVNKIATLVWEYQDSGFSPGWEAHAV